MSRCALPEVSYPYGTLCAAARTMRTCGLSNGGFRKWEATPIAGWFIILEVLLRWMMWGCPQSRRPPTHLLYLLWLSADRQTCVCNCANTWKRNSKLEHRERLITSAHKMSFSCSTAHLERGHTLKAQPWQGWMMKDVPSSTDPSSFGVGQNMSEP
jgi:hypothetical protein